MAVVEPAIKLVKLSDGEHKIDASFLEGHSWSEVTEIASKAFNITVYTTLPDLRTATAEEFKEYKNTLALIADAEAVGTYIEYIVVGDVQATAEWERIGTTQADLSNYVKKGVTYNSAALSNGAHTHTVTINTVSKDATMKLGATATGTAVGASGTDTFVKSYPGATSKLVTTSVTGVSGSTSASKATAGTAVTVAKRAASTTIVGNANVGTAVTVATKASTATKVGNADVGTAVSIPNVTGNSNVDVTNIASPAVKTIKEVDTITNGTAASFTQGSKASWSASVDSSGTLEFSWTTNGNDTFTANTPTVVTSTDTTGVVRSTATTPSATADTASKVTLGTAISVTPAKAVGTNSTTIYGCGEDTSVTPAVTSTTEIYGVSGTETITPYTFKDVTVPVAAAATTVATGSLDANGTGASVMTGLGTATTASAVTGVEVTANPTITITESTTNDGPVNEHITVRSTEATTSSDGAHTHNLKVTS